MRLKAESAKVKDARDHRASKLGTAIMEWQVLAAQRRYPRSLHDIVLGALQREYRLGQKRRKP